jgi:hypothetical protein
MGMLRFLVLAAILLLTPARVQAQTQEIQDEIDRKLWFQKRLAQIEAITGLPPLVALTTLLVVLLAIMAAIWLWISRRKQVE